MNSTQNLRVVASTIKVNNSRQISLVVAENQPLLLLGIASLFEKEGDIELVASATNGDEAIAAIRLHRPDVAVLSLTMPGKGALEVLEALASEQLRTRYVILAVRMNEDEYLRGVRLGLHGVVLKEMPAALLVHCVRTVHGGGEFLEKGLFLRTFGKLLWQSGVHKADSKFLTSRESAIADHVMRGLSNKQIARELAITEGTVKGHLHRAYTKLSVHGRMGLSVYVREHKGLV